MISTIGITENANAIEIAYALRSRCVKSNILASAGISIIAVVSAKEATIANIPMKKIGETKDIAECAAFLASDHAGYITGQVINVNGGMIFE